MRILVFALMSGLMFSPVAMAGFVTAKWNFDNGNINLANTATLTNPQSGLSISTFSFSPGSSGAYNNNSSSNTYAGASGVRNARSVFDIGALNTSTSDYFQISLTTDSSVTAQLTQFDFGLWRASNGPTNFVLRSSKDNYSANLASWTKSTPVSWTLETSNPSLALNSNETVTLRIYGFNGTGTPDPSVRLDDLTVGVNVSAVPEPGSVAIMSGLVAGLSVLSRRRRLA
jgi:hypothetical protein